MGEFITKDGEQVSTFMGQLDRMQSQLNNLTKGCKPIFNGEIYLTDKEVSERLRVSRRTLQEWRNSGMIDYIKLDGKIIYAESAVQKLLDKHHYKAWCE